MREEDEDEDRDESNTISRTSEWNVGGGGCWVRGTAGTNADRETGAEGEELCLFG